KQYLLERSAPSARYDVSTFYRTFPRFRAKAEAFHTLKISVSRFVISANLGPVVLPPAIAKRRRFRTKTPAFNGLNPGGVRETEFALAIDEAVTLVVIALHGVPIV